MDAGASTPDAAAQAAGGTVPRVRILPLQPGLGGLDYADPLGLAPGAVVAVPLGPRLVPGVVWEAGRLPARAIAASRLRPVARRLEVPPMAAPLRRLIDWIADYYLAPPGAVLRLALPAAAFEAPAAPPGRWRLSGVAPARLTPARARALAALGGLAGSPAELAAAAGVSAAVIRGLIAAGALEAVPAADAAAPAPNPDARPPRLEPAQAAAADVLRSRVAAGGFAPVLLEGVTGAGKTEVYAEGLAQVLRAGGQALLLLPEIALTTPFLARLEARFGAPPLAWHSGLPAGRRAAHWRAIASGRPAIVVGARSALFLPFARLGLIVVDECHEPAFKQDDGVPYHGRDAAIMRARFEGCPVVLASATPPLEARVQAEAGRYLHLQLPARFGGAALPAMRLVDLRRHPPPRGRWLAPPLVAAIGETLAAGEQALLFLNRRGYAPLTLCRACGERIGCPDCSAWLVEHRLLGRLLCHHCGFTMPRPPACPACGAPDTLAAIGPGVERVAEEAAALFPQARLAIATSDTLSGPGRAAAFAAAMESGALDLVVGTQLVTKGHHFERLTLVGVVDADLGLVGGDLRASERSFAQIQQAAGRAGRVAGRPGRVLIQTHQPEAPVLRALASGDAGTFYAAEAAARRALGMPPFGRLAALVVSDLDAARAEAAARALAAAAPPLEGLRLLGPAPAPIARVRGRWRWRLLVEASRTVAVQDWLRALLAAVRLPASTRVSVDVDPYSFL